MDERIERILAGDRRALSRAITLIESTRPEDRAPAEELLSSLLPHTGGAIRLGITGAPGAGKSTFIEALGMHVHGLGKRVAVLAIDPSSRRSGGSILGDKTRMQDLAATTDVFIRPSPAGSTGGGVGRRTREAALLCEAAGFHVILIETVGVGQSETAVADMVDCFLLMLAPGGGDELQGIKRGIVELADLVVVNKADGELLAPARQAQADYQAALRLLRPATLAWAPKVLLCSARQRKGIDAVWQVVLEHRQVLEEAGELSARRRRQMMSWLWIEIEEGLKALLLREPEAAALLEDLRDQVEKGEQLPPRAARSLVALMTRGQKNRLKD